MERTIGGGRGTVDGQEGMGRTIGGGGGGSVNEQEVMGRTIEGVGVVRGQEGVERTIRGGRGWFEDKKLKERGSWLGMYNYAD